MRLLFVNVGYFIRLLHNALAPVDHIIPTHIRLTSTGTVITDRQNYRSKDIGHEIPAIHHFAACRFHEPIPRLGQQEADCFKKELYVANIAPPPQCKRNRNYISITPLSRILSYIYFCHFFSGGLRWVPDPRKSGISFTGSGLDYMIFFALNLSHQP
jgi:hypothetical protein